MKLLFQMYQDREFYDLGILDTTNEEIRELKDGFEEWLRDELSLPMTPDPHQAEELLRTYEGPHIVAKTIEDDP